MRDNKNNLLPNGLGFSCFSMSVDWYSSMNNNKAPTMIAFKLGRLVIDKIGQNSLCDYNISNRNCFHIDNTCGNQTILKW